MKLRWPRIRWPFVSRTRFEAVDEKRASAQAEVTKFVRMYAAEKARAEAFEEFVGRFHRRRIAPFHLGLYRVIVEYDPLLFLSAKREHILAIAEHIGLQAAREIAASRHVVTPEIERWEKDAPTAVPDPEGL